MKPDCKKITQVINYLALHQDNGQPVDELKIIKLIWAADRYHLRKYARTVTNDNYVAMAKGPVASTAKDVAEFETNYNTVTDSDIKYIEKYFKFYQTNGNSQITATASTDMDELSETDIEALNFALEKFGKMPTKNLIELTHIYPEWKKHEQTLISERKVTKINLLDFFEDPKDLTDDPFSMSKDTLENSKEIYAEYA